MVRRYILKNRSLPFFLVTVLFNFTTNLCTLLKLNASDCIWWVTQIDRNWMSLSLTCLFASHETRQWPNSLAIKIMVSAGSGAHCCYLLQSAKSSQRPDMSQGYRESVPEIYLNIPWSRILSSFSPLECDIVWGSEWVSKYYYCSKSWSQLADNDISGNKDIAHICIICSTWDRNGSRHQFMILALFCFLYSVCPWRKL